MSDPHDATSRMVTHFVVQSEVVRRRRWLLQVNCFLLLRRATVVSHEATTTGHARDIRLTFVAHSHVTAVSLFSLRGWRLT